MSLSRRSLSVCQDIRFVKAPATNYSRFRNKFWNSLYHRFRQKKPFIGESFGKRKSNEGEMVSYRTFEKRGQTSLSIFSEKTFIGCFNKLPTFIPKPTRQTIEPSIHFCTKSEIFPVICGEQKRRPSVVSQFGVSLVSRVLRTGGILQTVNRMVKIQKVDKETQQLTKERLLPASLGLVSLVISRSISTKISKDRNKSANTIRPSSNIKKEPKTNKAMNVKCGYFAILKKTT